MILGVSVGLGWTVGVMVAQLMPSRNPEPPIQERVMRRSSATVQKLRQLPDWWNDPSPNQIAPSPDTSPVVPTPPQPAPSIPTPPPDGQEQVTADLNTLQQDLSNLETRLAELEQQAGLPGTGSLEERLQQLAARSQTEAPSSAPAEPTEPASPAPDDQTTEAESDANVPAANDGLGRYAAAPYQEPDFPVVSDRIVLPSALLFTPDGSVLTPGGEQLLNSILADLRRYGPATLLVGSHTDGDLSAVEARQLTFQQSLAVQQYLAPQLEDLGGRWIALGYGKTRPVAIGDAPGTEQRNQRVEIGIVRQ